MKEKSFLQLQAYDSIKNGILNGELVPGQLYSETKLSAQIGISRTPMREALQCLSQDGYITIIPSKGFMIRQLNEKDMNCRQYPDPLCHRRLLYYCDRLTGRYKRGQTAAEQPENDPG